MGLAPECLLLGHMVFQQIWKESYIFFSYCPSKFLENKFRFGFSIYENSKKHFFSALLKFCYVPATSATSSKGIMAFL